MKQLLVFDIDGTLRDEKEGIPPSAREAITLLKEKDNHICIATGRSPALVYDDIRQLNPDSWIYADGCQIDVQGKALQYLTLPKEVVFSYLEQAQSFQAGISLECEEGIWMNGAAAMLYHQMNAFKHKNLADEKSEYRDSLAEFDPDQNHVFKICLFCPKPQKFHHPDTVRVIHNGPISLEILPDKVSKGQALKTLQAKLGISRTQTLAFGDDTNDLPLFEQAGQAIAMANASLDIQARADWICPAVMENGIWIFLKERKLI